MTEKELIGKIRELRQIRPSQDWVSLTKSQILGTSTGLSASEESKLDNIISVFHVFFLKPAYAGLISVFVLFGIFGISQNSLPGDLLYPIKKITEKSQAVFVSEDEKPVFQLKLANERLEDLTKAPAKNLAPAISEFQVNVSEAAKKITKAKKADVKEIVKETKKLEENRQKVEALGIVIGETEELDNALAQLVEREIKDLEGRTLTEEQEDILAQAKEDYETGNYSDALIKILILSQSQE